MVVEGGTKKLLVKMAHLAARSHLKLEFRGSSPTIGKIVKFMSVYCIEKIQKGQKRNC